MIPQKIVKSGQERSRGAAPDATTTLRTSEVQARRIEEQREGGRGREERCGCQRHVTEDVALWPRRRVVKNGGLPADRDVAGSPDGKSVRDRT